MTSAVTNPELYDTIMLGGVRSPGKVTLSGHDRKINWSVAEGVGLVGGTTTLKNRPPIEFTATFYLADEDDKAAWPAFRSLIASTIETKKRPPPGRDAAVVSTRKNLATVENEIRSNRPTNQQEIEFFSDKLAKARSAYDQAQKTALAASAVKLMNALDIFHPYLAENDITAVCGALFGGAVDDAKGGVTYVIKFQEYKPPRPQTGSVLGSNTKPADPNQAALDKLDGLRKKWTETPWG